MNGELFVFGGEIPSLHGEVEAYNPITNTWRSLQDMPNPRHGIWASVIANKIFSQAAGMTRGLSATNVNDVFIVDILRVFEITGIERSGNNILVKFMTLANETYQVERKDDLLFNSWTPVGGSVAGTGGIVTVPDANAATLPQRFYHVKEL